MKLPDTVAATAQPGPGLLTRLGLTFNPQAISLPEGIRAALAVGPFLLAWLLLDWPLLRVAALAAYLTCLCDSGGPVNQRVNPSLAFGLIGGTLTFLLPMARAGGEGVAILCGAVALFGCAMLRVYGQAAAVMANLLGVTAVLALDTPQPPLHALGVAAAFVAGCLWASVLALAVWRLHPHLPARRALAAAYRALALLVSDLHAMLRANVRDQAAWEAHAKQHRHDVRQAIETARAAVIGAVRWLGPKSQRAVHGVIRLEVAEQAFSRLVALSDFLEHGADGPEREVAARLLRRLRPILRILAHGILHNAILHDESRLGHHLETATRAMEQDIALLPAWDPVRLMATTVVERVRIAITLALPNDYIPGAAAALPPRLPPLRQRLLDPLRANLSMESLTFRHALRVAVVAVPALAISMIRAGRYDHWLTITFVVTMQPYYAQTVTRAIERVGGTVLGALVAAGFGLFLTGQTAMTIATILLLLVAISIRYVSMGVFLVLLTPMVILLTETGAPGTASWLLAGTRAAYTALGGLIALIGSLILWPSFEPARLEALLRTAIKAHCAYAETMFRGLLGETVDIAAARGSAGLSSNNVEESLSRALLEPNLLGEKQLEAAMVVDAALRRMAGRLGVLHATQSLRNQPDIVEPWRLWIKAAGEALIAGSRPAPRPPLDMARRGAQSLARIARQIALMAEARTEASAEAEAAAETAAPDAPDGQLARASTASNST